MEVVELQVCFGVLLVQDKNLCVIVVVDCVVVYEKVVVVMDVIKCVNVEKVGLVIDVC